MTARRAAGTLGLAVGLAAARAWGQPVGSPVVTLTVLVRDAEGRPVPGAEVRAGRGRAALTDSLGRASLGAQAPGRHTLAVRGLGFYAAEYDVELPAPPDGRGPVPVGLTLVLARAPLALDTARAVATRPGAGGPVRTVGLTLDRVAIEARQARVVSDLFTGFPGVRVIGGVITVPRTGSGPLINAERPCTPVFYVDGVRRAGGQGGDRPATPGARAAQAASPSGGAEFAGSGYVSPLLGLTPDDVERITVYTALGDTPAQYASPDATCGVVVVATRRGGATR